MGLISDFFNKLDNREDRFTISHEQWDGVILCIANNIQEICELFFNKCVEAVKNNKHDIGIVNNKMGEKAEVVIKAYQIISIIQHLPRYIQPSEEKIFIDVLLYRIFGKKYQKYYNLAVCYMELGELKLKKRIYYFSIDIGKYICGYYSDATPSSFPCLNSYISSGIPRRILARTDVIASSLLIQNIVPMLTDATAMALALCFGDEEFAREIESNLVQNLSDFEP